MSEKQKGKLRDEEPSQKIPESEATFILNTPGIADFLIGQEGFAVDPVTTCPHVNSNVADFDESRILKALEYPRECLECKDSSENWLCLKCNSLYCSRYVSGHMAKHSKDSQESHQVCLSLSDLSIWCFACDSYIKDPPGVRVLSNIHAVVHKEFFGYEPPIENNIESVPPQTIGDSAKAGSSSGSSSK